MFIFFRTEHLTVTFGLPTVYIAFTRFAIKIIFPDYSVFFFVVDWNDKTFIKNITLTIPALPLNFWIFSVRYNSTMKLSYIFKSFTGKPTREFLTTTAASTI